MLKMHALKFPCSTFMEAYTLRHCTVCYVLILQCQKNNTITLMGVVASSTWLQLPPLYGLALGFMSEQIICFPF